MKILVFSDSHGYINVMKKIIELHLEADGVDRVFFLGDGIRDVIMLSHMHPTLKFDCVLGNCDDYLDLNGELPGTVHTRIIEAGGKKFVLTHGHKFDVKYGLQDAADYGISEKADCVLFGHTHEEEDRVVEGSFGGRVRMVNPGSCGFFKKSFAVINIVGGQISVSFGNG